MCRTTKNLLEDITPMEQNRFTRPPYQTKQRRSFSRPNLLKIDSDLKPKINPYTRIRRVTIDSNFSNQTSEESHQSMDQGCISESKGSESTYSEYESYG